MYKIIIIALFILLLGCSDSPVESTKVDTSIIMPLAVNNIWNYRISYINANGFHDSVISASISITHDTTIDSQTWFAAAVSNQHLFYQNRSDGLWLKEGTSPPNLIYKYPANLGDTYQAGINNISVIAQFQPVSALAGKFSCYAYSVLENSPNADSIVYYVAPGYGLIELIIYKWENNSYRVAEGWSLSSARFR